MAPTNLQVVRALDENVVLYSTRYFENTVQVVPPAAVVPRGRIVTHLGQPRDAAGFVRRDLFDANNEIVSTSDEVRIAYPFGAEQTNGTDNQLLRLGDLELLGFKNGYLWSALEDPPDWFGEVSIDLEGHTGLGTVRNAIYVFASTDNGLTWETRAVVDSATYEGGKYGWPQPHTDQPHWVGGFDRTEAYCDPWSGHLFITAHGDGGPFTKADGSEVSNHAGLVIRSTDNGVTWEDPPLFDGFGLRTSYQMTSTSKYALVVFRDSSKGPWLHVLQQGSTTLDGGQSVVVKMDGEPVSLAGDPGVVDIGGSPPSVARCEDDPDRVLIAYPTVGETGRQGYQLGVVTIDSGGTYTVDALTRIEAGEGRSCLLGTFVEDPDPTVADTPAPTLFYWIEAAPTGADDNALVARAVLIAGGSVSRSMTLSVANGEERTFGRVAIGHYVKGACFRHENRVAFLAQWSEADGIVGNVLSVRTIVLRRIPGRRTVDPLSLTLPEDVYERLTRPYPSPEEWLDQLVERPDLLSDVQRIVADQPRARGHHG